MTAGFFVLAAVASFFQGWRKRRLFDQQTDIDSIRNLFWRAFEELVAEAFRRQGYRVVENDSPGPDGGVDIVLHKEGRRHLVQCKNWRSRQVGVRVVREVYGVLSAENAHQAFIVCSGDFTPDARQFAAGKPIRLIDGNALDAMIHDLGQPAAKESPPSKPEVSETHEDPAKTCPKCGGQLVVRTAKRGTFSGRQFLGCATYPQCRHVQELPDVLQ